MWDRRRQRKCAASVWENDTQSEVDTSKHSLVELSVDARKLRVLDPEISEKVRDDTQERIIALGGRSAIQLSNPFWRNSRWRHHPHRFFLEDQRPRWVQDVLRNWKPNRNLESGSAREHYRP
jgi:hypothetical protein